MTSTPTAGLIHWLDRPPFRVSHDIPAGPLAKALEASFACFESMCRPATALVDLLLAQGLWSRQAPLCDFMVDIAAALDDERLCHPVAYHHRQHFCEVTLSAQCLALLGRFSPAHHLELLAAALIHDLDHDGSVNADQPFRLERRSLACAQTFLDRAAVPESVRIRLTALVLATDVANGLTRARAWFDHHLRGMPVPHGEEPDPAFAAFAVDPTLAQQAIALTEADALASAGLSLEMGDRQEARLAQERGLEPSPAGKLAYLDAIFADGFRVATAFNPNLDKLRLAARGRLGDR